MMYKGNKQLVARCFFCNSKVKYENYEKYYSKEKKDGKTDK